MTLDKFFFQLQYSLEWVHVFINNIVIIEVWIRGSEPTIIRKSALAQQLSVRKDPRS